MPYRATRAALPALLSLAAAGSGCSSPVREPQRYDPYCTPHVGYCASGYDHQVALEHRPRSAPPRGASATPASSDHGEDAGSRAVAASNCGS